MFTIKAHHNPYLRQGQTNMQVALSVSVDSGAAPTLAPLALAIALDCSGSMEGSKIRAARDGAIKVVQALDATMLFLVVAFNDNARILFGPALGSSENKQSAIAALQKIYATGGTRMSTALNTIVNKLSGDQTRASKILFLTDGKNEGEGRPVLNQAVARCAEANISIGAWGVGTDWDALELRRMADATHGNADIIPTPQQVEAAFVAAFSEMRKTAITNARLQIWTPVGATVKNIQQVYPNIISFGIEPDPANLRQQMVSLGSFAAAEQRDYLLDLEVPSYPPGQQFLMARPGIKYFASGVEHEEKSQREGWVFVQWTEDIALASQIEQHIAHYTNQEELSRNINEGQAALAAGDNAKATRLLARALEISEQTHNERMTKLLSELVQRDKAGTIQLNRQADAVARKTLAINVGRTSKLK